MIFWHEPGAIEIGRALYGILWNPDDCTQEQADEIAFVLRDRLRDDFRENQFDPQRDV